MAPVVRPAVGSILLLLIQPAAAVAETPTTTSSSAASTLSFADYLRAYRAASNLLPIRALETEIAEIEVQRRRYRATRELSVTPDVGPRLYHHTSPSDVEVVGELGAVAEYVYLGNEGSGYAVSAQALVPTATGRLGRTITYGVNGSYFLPLLRNFGGREFGYEVEAFEQRKTQAEALYSQEELLYCADAGERFLVRYATAEQLQAYQDLLEEKRRVWFRTAADYSKKMINRLDLLSAKSDWIFAQSLQPGFEARFGRADAALRAFAELPASLDLGEPPPLFEQPVTNEVDLSQHPEVKAIESLSASYDQEILLAREQGKDELDLRLSLGVDRFHDVPVPSGGFGETTDVHGFVGVRYLWPIERPDIGYRVRILERRQAQLEEQKRDVLRRLRVGVAQSLVTFEKEAEAYRLLQEQLEVLRRQIRSAYDQFRAGKLEFQNYLDHWDRYQRARLEIWDRWLSMRLAELSLIPLTGMLPEVCRAPPD